MTIKVLLGDFRSGLITSTVPVTNVRWSDVLNGAGLIDVTVSADVVRDLNLRQKSFGARNFLAVERDGRIKQAGPIWSRSWNWMDGELAVGAAGLWSWLDRQVVLPAAVRNPLTQNAFTVIGKSLGGVARALVERATSTPYGDVPIALPPDEAGDHVESFPLWSVPWCGEQLRQITQRATDAPDISFRGQRITDGSRYLQWAMRVGTQARPALSQGGPDWVFDTSSPQSPVLGIDTDEDATQMANRVWLTGNGMEEDMMMATDASTELPELGWPILDADELRSTVEDQDTLDGHAAAFLQRRNRPVEVFKVAVTAAAAAEVAPGDYARVITRGDVWLGDMDRRMRVRQVSGDSSDRVVLDMFPLEGLL